MVALSVKQAAEVIGVHPDTMRDYCDKGLVICERTPGGHRRIALTALDAFLARQAEDAIDGRRRAA